MQVERLNVLSLQPFYGGSHQAVIEGWIAHSHHNWDRLHLPPRHWKWRMRHAAIDFAKQVDQQWESGTRWDAFFTTDMLNVAEFRGLLKTDARNIPLGVYFHENQISYPNQKPAERDFHFAFTNLTTILAADFAWFNSEFNRQSLIAGLSEAAKHWPDNAPLQEIESIQDKSQIEIPGIQLPPTPCPPKETIEGPLRLVWAARWEHDKNPAGLLKILGGLDKKNIDFRLNVIGQTYRNQPAEFEQIRQEFSSRIDHWGHQVSRKDFWQVLYDSDVFLSTALHEFYGLAVVEGLAAGLVAILPDRLAYPETKRRFQDTLANIQLYDSIETCIEQLCNAAEQRQTIRQHRTERATEPAMIATAWPTRSPVMDKTLVESVKSAGRHD